MIERVEWPPLPDPEPNEPRKELKQLLYSAQLEVVKTQRQAATDIDKAHQQVVVDVDKARQQIAVDLDKARQQVAIDINKAQRQVAVDMDKARQEAAIEAEKVRVAANTEREKADWTNEYTQAQSFYNAYIEVAKSQIERAIARAEFVQTAAGAIGGAYTAILAFSFAVGTTEALPARGLLPTIFLGLAIVLAAGFLAYMSSPREVAEHTSKGTLDSRQRERRTTFINWTGAPIDPQSYLLQASVFSLAFGLAFLPAPYIKVNPLDTSVLTGGKLLWLLAGIAIILTFLLPALIKLAQLVARRVRRG